MDLRMIRCRSKFKTLHPWARQRRQLATTWGFKTPEAAPKKWMEILQMVSFIREMMFLTSGWKGVLYF